MKARAAFTPDFWAGLLAPVAVAGLAVAMVPLALARAWTLTWLWHWYIVPWFGAQQIPLAVAFGLMLVYLLVAARAPHKNDESRGFGYGVLFTVVTCGLTLFLGWLGSFFV